ncbi:6-phospho-beta-glucosidase [Kitasatospora setae]|uniref:family 4 glycosyl hydrolase n=1 Tax=Kitasatospora setae TaxID=2066 RepID=UPI0005258568|nr:6-phospho-beta-glucosidase [Kitasatospora setae]
MSALKLAIVGGASTYTPELIDGFARLRDTLPIGELVLIDPAADRLELIAALARRIFAKQGHHATVTTTTDTTTGVHDADAVLLQLRVGGQAARDKDETWPLECGCVGQETTGAGGLAKALRTVPVVLDIAERVRLLDTPDATTGTEVLPRLLTEHGQAIAADLHLPLPVIQRLGVVPSYYLRYFYQHDQVVKELQDKGSRAAEVAAIEKQLLELYADPALDTKPELLGQRGGAFYSEAAVQLIASLLGTDHRTTVQVVNTRNDGILPFLPDDAVIEVPATVDATGVRPLPQRPLEPLYAGLIASVTAYEHLALDAALHGGRDRVFDALLAHPLIGQIDLADHLTDRLLAHNRHHLNWA